MRLKICRISWVSLQKNQDNFSSLIVSVGTDVSEKKLHLLKQIPGLKDLKPEDLDSSPMSLGMEALVHCNELQSFQKFAQELSENSLMNLDSNKLSELAMRKLSPVLFHHEFHACLQTVMGFLDETDLTVMLEAMGNQSPKENAALVQQFVKSIGSQDQDVLREKFLTRSEDGSTFPFKEVLDLLHGIIEEVIHCQCTYNHHDTHGNQRRITSKLYSKISEELREIEVDHSDSFFSEVSRKIFFIQGIRNGLPRCAQVSADLNQSEVKVFQRINKHILRPIWWGTNLSTVAYAIVKAGRDVVFALRAFAFGILNGIKIVLNLFSGGYFTISSRNAISEDYNDTAFDMAEKINEQTPFDALEVAEKSCPVDVVTKFEGLISTRCKMPFFAPETKESDTENLVPEIGIVPV